MKFMMLLFACVFGVLATADSQVMRPHDRYYLIGDFETSNPWNWDTDTVTSNVREWASGVVFELDRGSDVEIRDITITCSRGDVCDRIRGGDVDRRRPLRIRFRRDLDVASVTVRAKPRGFSVPPPRVNVYLETWSGW